jgi:hypothetical protein
MAWVGLVAALAGTALQMKGQQEAGEAAKAQANFQAGQQDQQAENTESAALAQANKIRKQGRMNASSARAALAASGVKADVGSGLEAQRQVAANSENDALASILTGKREADALRSSANWSRRTGQAATEAAKTQQQGTALAGVGQAAGGWQRAGGTSGL